MRYTQCEANNHKLNLEKLASVVEGDGMENGVKGSNVQR